MFKCKNCNSYQKRYIGYLDNQPYCRKCILLKEKTFEVKNYQPNKEYHAKLTYDLTKTQQKAAKEILSFIKQGKSVLVDAVCGAGKTEIVYTTIEYFLNQGKKIGFTIPRKDVVIELYHRLKKDYPQVDVIAVYGNHTQKLEGQIIVLTTYQLYRYHQHFDLLILDEADAFPFYNRLFLKRSCKGPIIYLSATFNTWYLKKIPQQVQVHRRFHNVDLPIPKIILTLPFLQNKYLIQSLKKFKAIKKQVLIFVPTIFIGKVLAKKLTIPFVYAGLSSKQQIVDDFKNKQFSFLLTTTILERGITIDDIQVIIYQAEHYLFDLKTLVQICGRVGRKKAHPNGEIIFICSQKTLAIKSCLKTLKSKNNTIV